ncbi:MAG: hypothetical protein HRT44_01380 [Bdellovibrionales bacterium]|nr:hypothetical protein [Bdellovibrionales bacterium]NQZ17898.1 hypothetical protein [Bdellovibrionales bacterium]
MEFLKKYLGNLNIPTIVVSSLSIAEGPLVMEALASGASTYMQKPDANDIESLKADLLGKLKELSLHQPKFRPH